LKQSDRHLREGNKTYSKGRIHPCCFRAGADQPTPDYVEADLSAQQNATADRAREVWEKAFLSTLRKIGNVTRACAAAKIERSTAYRHRAAYPDFAEEWNEALDEAADRLEAEAWRRAVEGVLEPIYQKGEKVGVVRKYSDALMALLLKAHKPEKYRDRMDMTSGGDKLSAPIIYLPEVDQNADE
jgi:hypothetical protein